MSLPKQFTFTVENGRTHERIRFIGQGCDIMEALKDALKGADATFRPKNDGKQRDSIGVMAETLKHGIVKRSLKEFEGDVGYGETVRAAEEF